MVSTVKVNRGDSSSFPGRAECTFGFVEVTPEKLEEGLSGPLLSWIGVIGKGGGEKKFHGILLTKNLHIINKLINFSPLQPIHAGEFWSNYPLLVYGSKKKQKKNKGFLWKVKDNQKSSIITILYCSLKCNFYRYEVGVFASWKFISYWVKIILYSSILWHQHFGLLWKAPGFRP